MRYKNINISLGSTTLMLAVNPAYEVSVDSIDNDHSQVTVSLDGRAVHTFWTKNVSDKDIEKFAAMGFQLETLDLYSPGKSANGGAFGQSWEVATDDGGDDIVSARIRVDSKLNECAGENGILPYTDPKNDGVFALYICRFAVSPTRQELWLDDTAPIGKLCKRTAKEKDTARASCLISDAARLRERADTMEAEAKKILAKYPAKKAKKTS